MLSACIALGFSPDPWISLIISKWHAVRGLLVSFQSPASACRGAQTAADCMMDAWNAHLQGWVGRLYEAPVAMRESLLCATVLALNPNCHDLLGKYYSFIIALSCLGAIRRWSPLCFFQGSPPRPLSMPWLPGRSLTLGCTSELQFMLRP